MNSYRFYRIMLHISAKKKVAKKKEKKEKDPDEEDEELENEAITFYDLKEIKFLY